MTMVHGRPQSHLSSSVVPSYQLLEMRLIHIQCVCGLVQPMYVEVVGNQRGSLTVLILLMHCRSFET